jgi:membrane protein
MPKRPFLVRLGWTFRDYAKRVWDNSAEDNVLFLAGGVAFNILLAAIPFFLLIVSGVTLFLDESPDRSSAQIAAVFDDLFPTQDPSGKSQLVLRDIFKAGSALGVYSAIGFVWFSTRLFGSLRTVLAEVFDIENERGIVAGKIFDIKITVMASLLIVAYIALSAYLAIATTRGVRMLVRFGLRNDLMSGLEYWVGRLLAFAFILTMFFALYKFLPVRRVRWQTCLLAATFSSLMLELAKLVFGSTIASISPSSFYTGTFAALVLVVVWVYYTALIFIVGGEVGQVFELRRVRRLQREVLYETD